MKARDVYSLALLDALGSAAKYAESDASRSLDERIHGFRRAVRRARGLLRVARAGMDDETRSRLNEMLRSANASTSPLRDAAVLFDALDGLAGISDADAACERARAFFEAQIAVASQSRNPERVLSSAAEAVATVRLVLESVKLQDLGASDVAKALSDLWEKASEAREEAIFSGDREHFHVWRKRTKELRYGIQALVDAGAPLAGVLHDLKLAARAQGEVMDAFVLRDALAQVDFDGVEESAYALFESLEESVTLGMRMVIAEFALPFAVPASSVRRKVRRVLKDGLRAAGEKDDPSREDDSDDDAPLALDPENVEAVAEAEAEANAAESDD